MFGTMKDNSLSINTLASKNYLYHRNFFQNGVKTFSKMVNHFLPKKLKIFRTIRFCSNFTRRWPKYLSNNVWRDFGLQVSASVMITWKCPIRKSIFAVNLPLKLLRATVANDNIEVFSLSINIIWYVFEPHAGEL